MTRAEVAALIEVEHNRAYTSCTGERRPPSWMLYTPVGWAWVQGGHAFACFSASEAKDERESGDIEPCTDPECDTCHQVPS